MTNAFYDPAGPPGEVGGGLPQEDGSAKDAIGKEGDWQSLNLRSSENLPASGIIPHRSPPEDSIRKVKAGFSKTDPLNRRVRFGRRLHIHLIDEVEPLRAQWLLMAEKTVEHPAEIWEHDHRHFYIGRFEKTDGGDMGSMVVAARLHENENNVVTYSPKNTRDLKSIRKGKLIHANY